MRWHIPILIALLAAPMPGWASKNAYDMGKVQVVGKDAQSEAASAGRTEIEMEMGEKPMPMPEILPEALDREPGTLEEKPFLSDRPRSKDEVSVFVGKGTRGSSELRATGKGTFSSYVGELSVARETRDGFRSSVDDRRTVATGKLSTSGEGSYQLNLTGQLGSDRFAQRGTRASPSPLAGIDEDNRGFTVRGNSTLSDGAYFSAYGQVDSANRNTANPAVGFSEDGELLSTGVGAEYRRSLRQRITGRAALDLRRDRYSITDGPDQKFTKRTSTLAADIELNDKAFLTLGLKDIRLMERSRFTPLLKLDYRWSKPWQFLLSYEEDLGNDSLREVYLPRRYVSFASLTASHERRLSGRFNYRANNGNLLGAELFRQREGDAIEYVDMVDPAKGMLVSAFRFAPDAHRTGIRLHGSFKLEDSFTLTAAATFQDPRDDTNGRRLSYEARRLLEIGFGYAEGPIHLDFTRHAAYDRTAYVPAAAVDAGDYSRSDLVLRYDFRKHFQAYFKVKDLYDEAKSLRFNVPEEGRVSLAGVEASF